MREEKEKLWNLNYCKVMLANFALFFAFYLLTPLLPLYLSETFHATKDLIGLVLSGYTLTALLIRPFSGYIVDSFPRKRVLMVCYFFFFILFGGYLAAGTFVLFAVVRRLHGGPFGALTVANSTVAIDVLPSSRRTEGIGYYGLSNNLSMAIAPSVGVFVYKYLQNFDILFWGAFVIAGIGLLIDSTVKAPARQVAPVKRKLSLDRFFLTRGWLLGVNIALFSFCFGVLSNYLAIYSKEILHITGGTGTYFLLLSVGLVASRLQGAKALRQGKLTRNCSEGIVISCVGYFLFVALANPVGYYLSALLIGLGNGHMFPAMQNMFISIASHNERGTANSTLLTSWDVGIGVGIIGGGVMTEHFGYTFTFGIVSAVCLAGVLLFVLAGKDFYLRHKRVE